MNLTRFGWVPLFIKSDKTEVCNYRLVSILTVIAKVFERVVHDQVKSYLDQKRLFFINFNQVLEEDILQTRV